MESMYSKCNSKKNSIFGSTTFPLFVLFVTDSSFPQNILTVPLPEQEKEVRTDGYRISKIRRYCGKPGRSSSFSCSLIVHATMDDCFKPASTTDTKLLSILRFSELLWLKNCLTWKQCAWFCHNPVLPCC